MAVFRGYGFLRCHLDEFALAARGLEEQWQAEVDKALDHGLRGVMHPKYRGLNDLNSALGYICTMVIRLKKEL